MTAQTPPVSQRRLVVAISGTGRTLENLIAVQNKLHFTIVGVVASRTCSGLKFAEDAQIPTQICNFKDPASITNLGQWLDDIQADFIALAGFIQHWPLAISHPRPVLNVHPALLPDFGGQGMYGHHVHKAVKEAQSPITGATVHLVTENYDEGPILGQARVAVDPDDSIEAIAQKVFIRECELYPLVLDQFAQGKLHAASEKVILP